jgi:glutathione synthase/RimK-type ligase-like ATP-grasp enzyme
MIRALGVYRERQFSPGKVQPDAAILDAVMGRLAAHAMEVRAITPAEFINDASFRCDLIMAMCQSLPALDRLTQAQAAGALVINTPAAIRSCYRDRMGLILSAASLPVPAGILLDTSPPLDTRALRELRCESGIYVKRGDLHALHSDDVRRVDDETELRAALQDFADRGIDRAYLQRALEGRVIKFYGVGAGFFTAAESAGISATLHVRLRAAAQAAALALGLEVWGGDAIVSGEQFNLVDFNDWPSFERVRTDAAAAIARRAVQLLQTSGRG